MICFQDCVTCTKNITSFTKKDSSKSSNIPPLTNKLLFSGKDQPICFGYSGNISTGRIDRATRPELMIL